MRPITYALYIDMLKNKVCFSHLLYHWKKEQKPYASTLIFSKLKCQIQKLRRIRKHLDPKSKSHWLNFDVRHYMEFVDKYLNWSS